jgi:hypothetical protein
VAFHRQLGQVGRQSRWVCRFGTKPPAVSVAFANPVQQLVPAGRLRWWKQFYPSATGDSHSVSPVMGHLSYDQLRSVTTLTTLFVVNAQAQVHNLPLKMHILPRHEAGTACANLVAPATCANHQI